MKYDIFISYRREGGYDTAKHLNDLLVRDGYRVSFDIDTLRSGDFDTQLFNRIDQCKDFILIVDRHAFERTLDPTFNPKNDWMRCELAYALKKGKNIIPVFLSGVTGFPDNLPNDIADVSRKNGPEFNRYHFNSFYDILKKRFLHRTPFYRQKCFFAFLLLVILAMIAYLLFPTIRYDGKTNGDSNQENNDITSIVKETLPDYASLIIEKYENTPDDATDRADIVDVIKAFLDGADSTICQSWSVFSSFVNNRQIIPLSQGIEDLGDSLIFPYKRVYISKLIYKGNNLDSDIDGQSTIQEISLMGPRMGPLLLSINTRNRSSYEIGKKLDGIIKDAGFTEVESKREYGINYELYRNDNDSWLYVESSGGSGGDSFEWIVSYSRNVIFENYMSPSNTDND